MGFYRKLLRVIVNRQGANSSDHFRGVDAGNHDKNAVDVAVGVKQGFRWQYLQVGDGCVLEMLEFC